MPEPSGSGAIEGGRRAAAVRQLAGQGYDEAVLGVDLGDPTGALGVYERLGCGVVLRRAQHARPPLRSPATV